MLQDPEQATLEAIRRHAPLRGARVVEVGCGQGQSTADYAHLPDFILGIEPDISALEIAVDVLPRLCFAAGCGTAIPVKDCVFDIALFTLSLHHAPSPSAALTEASRVLRPMGCILALEPLPECELQRLCKAFHDEDHALKQAESALNNHDKVGAAREIVERSIVFDDFAELESYVFNYYHHPPDPAKSQELRSFLGKRAHQAPLVMTQQLRLDCLQKRG